MQHFLLVLGVAYIVTQIDNNHIMYLRSCNYQISQINFITMLIN